ncbi:MAG: hypothetical protein AB7F22_31390 [Reyranella sp.]|uniref:hypothetical protein n=1 Tax=Reyranella sp. TaxID=1929291 RepID=UPI003D096321
MRYPPLILISLAAFGIALASCGSSTNDSADTAADEAAQDMTPEEEAELMRQAAIEAGLPMPEEEIPVVSERTYKAGYMNLKVSGFFDINASPALDTVASISDGGYTWIQYGKSGEAPPNATVTIGNGDIGIGVGVGRFVATGTTIECEITTEVTPNKVSGHYSCPKVAGYNMDTRAMGDVKIEVDFEATS